jgi:ABC-type multidrug transport system ATPase subunit
MSAGVDVNLRGDMWALVRKLREEGVTIILRDGRSRSRMARR